MKINLKKLKEQFRKGKRFAREKTENIEHYLELNRRQALKMKPRTKDIRF